MDRRNLFQILGATALAEVAPAAPFTVQFFKGGEAGVVERLADIILPPDGASPGAQEAGVLRFLDLVLHYGDAAQQQAWRSGLAAVEAAAQQRFGQGFGKLDRAKQEQIVAQMAENEGRRSDALGLFFVPLKRLTIEAYHYSAVHWKKNMGRGMNVAAAKFPGCAS